MFTSLFSYRAQLQLIIQITTLPVLRIVHFFFFPIPQYLLFGYFEGKLHFLIIFIILTMKCRTGQVSAIISQRIGCNHVINFWHLIYNISEKKNNECFHHGHPRIRKSKQRKQGTKVFQVRARVGITWGQLVSVCTFGNDNMIILYSWYSPGQGLDPGSVSLFQLCQFLLQQVSLLPQAGWVFHLSIQQIAQGPVEHTRQIITMPPLYRNEF